MAVIDQSAARRPELVKIAEQNDGLALASKMRSAGIEALMTVGPDNRILTWDTDRTLARRSEASPGTVPPQPEEPAKTEP